MPLSEAQKRANRNWNQNKVDTIYVRIPKGNKDDIKAHAESCGESLNEFVFRAIMETMERDRKKK